MLDFNAVQPAGQYRKAMFDLSRQQPTNALNQVDESTVALKRAEALAPKDPQIPFAQAQVFSRAGRNDKAKVATIQALRIQPDFAPAQQLLETLAR